VFGVGGYALLAADHEHEDDDGPPAGAATASHFETLIQLTLRR
jgi:hypothetical protein